MTVNFGEPVLPQSPCFRLIVAHLILAWILLFLTVICADLHPVLMPEASVARRKYFPC
jgi:hypothetical protein